MKEINELYKKEDSFLYLISGEGNVELVKLYVTNNDQKIRNKILEAIDEKETEEILKQYPDLSVKTLNKASLFLLNKVNDEEFWIYFKKWINNQINK